MCLYKKIRGRNEKGSIQESGITYQRYRYTFSIVIFYFRVGVYVQR